ncbi:MAG TPA: hypothetical protein PLO78_07155 [Candidatus Omnitrophota bacterium]|nr:hypothetical protein [Candidatus Omnitrophota bacterium]
MNRDALNYGAIRQEKVIHSLVGDMATATHIVKTSGSLHVAARNFDRAATLLENAGREKPFLVILDFEKCEAEAFQTLNMLRQCADLKSIPVVGFLNQAKGMMKPEAEKAGCFRVYLKTEFCRELPDLIARYAV